MNWTPTPWIAAVLAVASGPLAMLYAKRPRLAVLFAIGGLAIGLSALFGLMSEGGQSLSGFIYWIAGPVVAFICARSSSAGPRPSYSRWYGLLGVSAMAVGCIVALRAFFYEPYKIPSSAMVPTLMPNARILVEKRPGELRRSEFIVFDYPVDPSITFVKRLIGLPGDRIRYVAKRVWVNGHETRVRQLDDFLEEGTLRYQQHYLNRLDGVSFETLSDAASSERADAWTFPMSEACSRAGETIECVIPPGHYFVMGDNRDNSADSRYWGFLRSDLVIGRVVKIIQ